MLVVQSLESRLWPDRVRSRKTNDQVIVCSIGAYFYKYHIPPSLWYHQKILFATNKEKNVAFNWHLKIHDNSKGVKMGVEMHPLKFMSYGTVWEETKRN